MKTATPIFFALLALTGLANCVLLEPALAYQDEAMHSDSAAEDSDCCFIHCAICHQWTISDDQILTHPNSLSNTALFEDISFYRGSVSGSIFHPPLAV